MRKINLLRSFKKDYEKVKKQSWDLNTIDDVIQCLMNLVFYLQDSKITL